MPGRAVDLDCQPRALGSVPVEWRASNSSGATNRPGEVPKILSFRVADCSSEIGRHFLRTGKNDYK